MVDYTEVTLLAASAFFAVLSFSLLYRYRQVSQRLNESTDVARDLWQALDQRMRKQDERILDLMARFDVVQARVIAASTQATMVEREAPRPASVEAEREAMSTPASEDVTPHVTPLKRPVAATVESQLQPAPHVTVSQAPLDETEVRAVQLLSQNEMNTRQITNALGKSREHTARIMKGLFEMGLVTRDDSQKPFVYRLTEVGRSRVQS